MDQSIAFEYSPALIPACILLGLAYALILYFNNRKEEFYPKLRWLLGILRTVVIAVIAFLLLGPSVRSIKRFKEKPILIVASDNSVSVVTGSDSAFYLNTWPDQINNFKNSMNDKFDVRSYLFGDDVTVGDDLNFKESYTDFSDLFNVLESNFSHRNVGALIIASDGIINRGANPLNLGKNIQYPVYTLALGDTSIKKDVIINKINYNRIAYLDNAFPVEIIVNGKKVSGEHTTLKILKDGKVIYEEQINFKTDDDYQNILVRLKAEKTGNQRFTVQLSEMGEEVSVENNRQDFFIDILEGKQKILLLANSPHPDISAIEQALSENLNFTLDIKLASEFNDKIENYNLIILHGLPSAQNPMTSLLKEASQRSFPVWYILDQQSDLKIFNTLETGLQLETDKVLYNETLPKLNPDFSLFGFSKDANKVFSSYPPLYSPYTDMHFLASAQIMIFQQVGQVVTENPLFIFNQDQNRKNGILLGEGIWRWRLADYAQNSNHEQFDELINKIVRFLTLKVDKSLFRVYCKNSFDTNDEIEFTAELYNDSYELINDLDVTMEITGSNGNNYPFNFLKSGKTYYLNAENLPVDNYSYNARVKNGDKMLVESGEFTVKSINLEKINTVADHNLLFNIAATYGGQMYYPDQLNNLKEDLDQREDIKTIVYIKKQFSELLNLPWILGMIILLLSIEWFFRKRAGSY